MEEITTFAVRTGWWAMLAGVVSGAIIGHISSFGLGFIKRAGRLCHPHFIAERTRRFMPHLRYRMKNEIKAKHVAAASAA